MSSTSRILSSACAAAALAAALSAQVQVDRQIPAYTKTAAVSGSIKSVGSDTMNNLMTLWAEGFKKMYPNVQVEIEGKGSSTAPPALIAGTATFGPMSREMKAKEIDDFEKKYGYKPTALATGDRHAGGLCLTRTIRSPPRASRCSRSTRSSRRPASSAPKDDMRDLGRPRSQRRLGRKPISLFGRNSASGTYGYFKETRAR
jgi:phosphate transport system substrate-binding protein